MDEVSDELRILIVDVAAQFLGEVQKPQVIAKV